MKIETLKGRLESTNSKIKKVESILAKHKNQLEKINYKLEKNNINAKTCNWEDYRATDIGILLYDYNSKLNDIENNEKKLKGLYKDKEKYSNILDVEIKRKNNINNIIPPSVIQFLENWKQQASEYYIKLSNEYIEKKFKNYEATEELLKEIEYYSYTQRCYIKEFSEEKIKNILEKNTLHLYNEDVEHYKFKKYKENLHSSDLFIVEKIVNYDTIKNDVLEKILSDDVEYKKESFIEKISKTTGIITDMTRLSIGATGQLEGIVKGEKATAYIKTISCGGYNIQCFHYRIIVNKI